MRLSHRALAVWVTAGLAVALVSVDLQAQGRGRGRGQAQGQGAGEAARSRGSVSVTVVFREGDYAAFRDYFISHRIAAEPLPPGIAKNVARGKPLPPGIAKKLDGRLVSRLPHYEGYDWVRAGTDLILVAVATGIIYEVLEDVMD